MAAATLSIVSKPPFGRFTRRTTSATAASSAVNLGEDADTTGAVYGQIAGAYYGEEGIPRPWRAVLAMRNKIEEAADRLYEMVESTRCVTRSRPRS